MKVAELNGAELDYWVAKAEGLKDVHHPSKAPIQQCFVEGVVYSPFYYDHHADPIIEREKIEIAGLAGSQLYQARMPNGDWHEGAGEFGANTAAMRAFVHSKFGAEVKDKP